MLKPRETDDLLMKERLEPRRTGSEPANQNEETEKDLNKDNTLHFKIRLDFKGKAKPAKFFFGGKNTQEVAQITREQQAALWKNVPIQGIDIIEINEGEIYTVFDEEEEEIAFAPLIVEVKVDSLEDVVRFVVKEEFRRLEIVEPDGLSLSKQEIERLLFKIHLSARDQVFLELKKNLE